MINAGIFIDSWKLAIFKKVLDEGGFSYREANGPTDGVITLFVQTESVEALHPLVMKANGQAARSKMH